LALTESIPSPRADPKARALNQYLDVLDQAAAAGPAKLMAAMAAPPPGLSAQEINLQRILTRVGAGHLGLLGYTPQQMLGRPASEFVVMKETSEAAMARKLLKGASLLPYSRTFTKADGTDAFLLLVDRQIVDPDGNVVGIRTALCSAR
jgi:PAS domain-containing protein